MVDSRAAMGQSAWVESTLLLPRFDSFAAVVLNVVAILVFTFGLYDLARRRRRGVSVPIAAWLLSFAVGSIGGVLVPLGPVLVLAVLRAPTRRRAEPSHTATR